MRLRQDLYRRAYYPPHVGASDDPLHASRRSGWASPGAQQRAYEAFLRILPRNLHGDVLDLGCGDGALLRWLVTASGGTLVPYGVDFLPESIDAARAQAAPTHRDHYTIADASDFEPGRHFALVLTSLCYVLPPTRAELAARCRRWLQPDGCLVLYEYRGSPLFEGLFAICAQLGLPTVQCMRDGDVALVTIPAAAPAESSQPI